MTQSPPFLSSVEHIMNADVPFVYAEDTVSSVRSAIESNDGCPVAVVDSSGRFRGFIDASAVLTDSIATAGVLASSVRLSATLGESAFDLVSRMLARSIEWVPVLESGRLVGVITRDCVKSAFGETYTA